MLNREYLLKFSALLYNNEIDFIAAFRKRFLLQLLFALCHQITSCSGLLSALFEDHHKYANPTKLGSIKTQFLLTHPTAQCSNRSKRLLA